MNEQELRNMEESGMIIGGHTVNHNVLSSLDEHDQREEIVNNIKVLEKILGHRIQWFCFPYGGTISYNETTIALLKEYGIHYCLSVEHRDVSTKDMASPFALPRYDCTCFPYGKSYITKNV
jgi:peptidoglycan/xylan/chitin deacetylase (PgdA/CDA1 family)